MDDLKSKYNDAFGDSFEVIDPTLEQLFSAVAQSEQTRDLTEYTSICDSDIMANAMTLDMVRRLQPRRRLRSHTVNPRGR